MAAPPFCVFPRSQTVRKDANSAKSRKTKQNGAKRGAGHLLGIFSTAKTVEKSRPFDIIKAIKKCAPLRQGGASGGIYG